jgi:hypothetical protein
LPLRLKHRIKRLLGVVMQQNNNLRSASNHTLKNNSNAINAHDLVGEEGPRGAPMTASNLGGMGLGTDVTLDL